MSVSTFHPLINMSAEESKMEKLVEFFQYRYNLELLQRFISPENKKNRNDKLSLRLLEWFVVNYAKQHGISYTIIRPNGRHRQFMVWVEYDSVSKSEGKRYFDPFGRGKSKGKAIELEYEQGKKLTTTVAQLNFFRWAIKYNIIDYVEKHMEEIYEDMTTRNSVSSRISKATSKATSRTSSKKRQLSTSVSKTLSSHSVKSTGDIFKSQ